MAKRWLLLVATNAAAVVIVTIVLMILPFDMNTTLGLALVCLVVGLAGAFVSLWLSVPIAKNFYGVREANADNAGEAKLAGMVQEVAERAGIDVPEVGVYESSEPNAFATGPNEKGALIAVSTGMLELCDANELRGVIAHEVGHIRSGDMVTMTLLMGIANAFVLFLARIVARAIDSMVQGDEKPFGMGIWAYWILVWILETLFMILAYIPIAWYSRQREYAADATAAALGGKAGLIGALRKVDGSVPSDEEQPRTEKRRDMYAFSKLSNKKKGLLFATHPTTESRIEYLETGELPKLSARPDEGEPESRTAGARSDELTGKRFTLIHAAGSILLFGAVFLYVLLGIEPAGEPDGAAVPFSVAWFGLLAWSIVTVVGVGKKALGRAFFVRIAPFVTGTIGIAFLVLALMMPLGVLGTLVELVLVAAFAALFTDALNARRSQAGEPTAALSFAWVKRVFTANEGFRVSRVARIAVVCVVALLVAFSNISGSGSGGSIFASSGSSSRSARSTRSDESVPTYVKIDVAIEYELEMSQIVDIRGRMTQRTPLGGEMWQGEMDVRMIPGGPVHTLGFAVHHE